MTFLNNFKSKNLPVTSSGKNLGFFKSDLDDFFDDFYSGANLSNWANVNEAAMEFVPTVDVKETAQEYIVEAELPAMDEKDISLTIEDNVLILEGEKKEKKEEKKENYYHMERSFGRFYRQIPFACKVDEENASASYKDGILKINVAKAQSAITPKKKIDIKTVN